MVVNMEQCDGVVVASIVMFGDSVWFVAAEYLGDDLFAAYRYDKDTDDLVVLLAADSFDKCVARMNVDMIGVGRGV